MYRIRKSGLVLLSALALCAAQQAYADKFPATCSNSGASLGLTILAADGETDLTGSELTSCESVFYKGSLAPFPTTGCDIEGGTLTVVTPDGVPHNFDLTGIRLTQGDVFETTLIPYTVDVVGSAVASVTWSDGIVHNANEPLPHGVGNSGPFNITNPIGVCDDGNPCTDDFCNPDTIVVLIPGPTPEDPPIAFRQGACDTTPHNCDDNNVCTDDSCDPEDTTGDPCRHVDNSARCDDNNVCTDDSCDPILGCVNTDNSARCNDNNVCTDDSCDPILGCVNTDNSARCNDNNVCTDDSCDPILGCVNTDNSARCNDNNACTDDSCDPILGCVNTDNSARCDDGDPCTDDRCDPVLGCVNTDNGTCGNAGCTPGFWKNCTGQWCATYSTGQLVNTVFTIPACIGTSPVDIGNRTLLQGLSLQGGSGLNGAAQILVRAGVAALLNACKGIGYPLTTQQVIDQVNDALDNCNRADILNLAATLDGFNNLGCRDRSGNSLPCLR